MGDEAEKIASLEKTVFKQDKQIQALSDKSHELDIELTKILGALKGTSASYSRLDQQLTESTKGIYERFDTLDNELKDSFEKRDDKIVELQIDNAKVNTRQLIYASVSFTVITIMIQIGKGLL